MIRKYPIAIALLAFLLGTASAALANEPVSNATVTLQSVRSGDMLAVPTGTDGLATFNGPAPGPYKVIIDPVRKASEQYHVGLVAFLVGSGRPEVHNEVDLSKRFMGLIAVPAAGSRRVVISVRVDSPPPPPEPPVALDTPGN